ncbi:MAG: metallophosphoesterase [Peptostreptococcaceae bacterium]
MKKTIKKIISLIISIILVCLFIYGYARFIEPKLLITKIYNIGSKIENKNEKQSLKVVQFTDTQLGEYYSIEQLEDVVKKINQQNPDIVVFTGDLIDRASGYEDINKVGDVLSKIDSKLGKFAVWGNHDYGGGGHLYYEKIMNKGGFVVLENETLKIDLENNKSITVSGLDETLFKNPNPELIKNNIQEETFNILLLHEPDLVDNFINTNVDLALAGHTHGGQVKIPFIGAIVTPPYGEKYVEGFYDISDTGDKKIYVNTGIGNTKLVYRFMNIPQIELFEIEV